jgi:hypothetical protein
MDGNGLPPPEVVEDILGGLASNGLIKPGAACILDIGTDRYLEYVQQELLADLVRNGGATCRFYEGVFGSGKSHLLDLLAEVGLRSGMAVVRTELSYALSLETWRLVTKHVLSTMELRIAGRDVRGLPEILREWGFEEAVDTWALRKASLPHPGFAAAMAHGVANDYPAHGRDWLNRYLVGERVSALELRKRGVDGVKNPLSDRNAEPILNTVLAALNLLGIRGTLLLFDETERTFQRNTKRARVAANTIRRLIDGCADGRVSAMLAVFSVLPNFLGSCGEIYPALGSRLRVPRGGQSASPAWRWPVLPIRSLNITDEPEDFLEGLAERFAHLARHCGATDPAISVRLREAGHEILAKNVGDGVRREMVKRLATIALSAVD